jgi:hypothetical protein
MDEKSLGMDNRGTQSFWRAQAAIVLDGAAPCWKPPNGFEWIEGCRIVRSPLNGHFEKAAPDANSSAFLRPRPWKGDWKQVAIPDDLYLRFSGIKPTREGIIEFAETYGSLNKWGCQTPFRRQDTRGYDEGESLSEWELTIGTLKAATDLWFSALHRDRFEVERLCRVVKKSWDVRAPGVLVWPGEEYKDDFFGFARAAVISTVNRELNTGDIYNRENDAVHTLVGATKAGAVLRMIPTNLRKALWLQFTSYIVGDRTVKRCEAPDCPMPLMDVTNSKRPGARRMHEQCQERMRKRRWRAKNLRG